MHMGNELMSPVVSGGLTIAAAVGVGYAVSRGRKELDERKTPLMGVMGAFVFAAQMLNFPVLPGTSGHLGGGALLAIVLGPHLACICMTSILIVQCLVFQDGGLFALGANVINMGIIGPYLGYAVYRLAGGVLRGKSAGPIAAALAAFIGVVAGSVAVPIETSMAGMLQVPFPTFLWTMLGIHVVIGVGEAVITVATLSYVHALRPEVMKWELPHTGLSLKGAAASLLIIALLLGGVLSFYASGSPDGLEKAIEGREIAEAPAFAEATKATDSLSVMPDYVLPVEDDSLRASRISKGIAGAVGTLVTLGVVFGLAQLIRSRNGAA